MMSRRDPRRLISFLALTSGYQEVYDEREEVRKESNIVHQQADVRDVETS
jgi:hypothetical protein